jgi:uncharacterized protein
MESPALYEVPRYHALEREGRLIVFNPGSVNPLFVESGGRLVLEALSALEGGRAFAREDVDSRQAGLFEMLAGHGLLSPVRLGRSESAESDCPLRSSRSQSKSVYLILTNSCNQRCVYCLDGAGTYRKESPEAMDIETAKTALEGMYSRIADRGYMEIIFFGGEPLLNWPLAKEIIAYVEEELNVAGRITAHFHLTTNLTLFPPDLIDRARAHDISFLVDVDGPQEVHDALRPLRGGKGSYAITARNIGRLVEAGIEVALRATITSQNQDLRGIVATHKSLGGASSALVPVNPIDSDMASFPESILPDPEIVVAGMRSLARESPYDLRKLFPFNEYLNRFYPDTRTTHGCGAPYGNTPVICADGDIFSCIYLVGNEEFKIGSVRASASPVYDDNLKRMRDAVSIDSRPRCAECPYRNLCGGGCPVCELSIARNPAISRAVKDYSSRMTCMVAKMAIEETLWYAAGEKMRMAASAAGGEPVVGAPPFPSLSG